MQTKERVLLSATRRPSFSKGRGVRPRTQIAMVNIESFPDNWEREECVEKILKYAPIASLV
jgi:hypothetical protein